MNVMRQMENANPRNAKPAKSATLRLTHVNVLTVDHVLYAIPKQRNANSYARHAKGVTLILILMEFANLLTVEIAVNAILIQINANQQLVKRNATNATLRMENVNPAVETVLSAMRKLTNVIQRNVLHAPGATQILKMMFVNLLTVEVAVNAILIQINANQKLVIRNAMNATLQLEIA